MERIDGRSLVSYRPTSFELDYTMHAEGSVLVSMGNTKVICTATIEEQVPRWMKDQEKPGGWITAEYSMLPRATNTRNRRETKGKSGRTQEISRLIGRSLRAAVDLEKLGQRSILVDCDVIQADGGTRTASINGGYVALVTALKKVSDLALEEVLASPVGAISVGVLHEKILVDLCYEEDVAVDADINLVMNGKGELIEIQGTAEGTPFSRDLLDQSINLSWGAIEKIVEQQKQALSL